MSDVQVELYVDSALVQMQEYLISETIYLIIS